MKGFQKILVPLDFSDNAEQILGSALRVVGEGGTVTLLHVVEWLPAVTEGTFGIYPHRKDIEKIKELSRAKLGEMVRRHPEENLEAVVREGKAAHVILQTIGEREPDLVVMGTHGRSKLDHLLIGSVAERVIRHAPCAVLTVRF
ncbi:MAG: universal stress protein [Planctomycetota bacterium]|nr:universal stress protein [Planctomycetota bacterium]